MTLFGDLSSVSLLKDFRSSKSFNFPRKSPRHQKMRNFVLVFLVFLSIQLIVKCEEKCHAEGKCAGDELTTYTDTASEMVKSHNVSSKTFFNPSSGLQDCLIHCKDYPGCQWYSFYPERTYCWLYSKCDTISAADCSTCSTGEVSCPLPTCSVPGGCQVGLNPVNMIQSDEIILFSGYNCPR